jgi:type I restriction enzyme M protein
MWSMLDNNVKKIINNLWDKFWAGGLVNGFDAIDQMNTLIFLRILEEKDKSEIATAKRKKSNYVSIFENNEKARWSYFSQLTGDDLVKHMQYVINTWLKGLKIENDQVLKYIQLTTFKLESGSLIREAITSINSLDISNSNFDIRGDIFEYMLSKLNKQGDGNQFRTPRHIIDLMVNLINPQFGEKIIDPAVGTGGFLISSHNHLLRSRTSEEFIKTDNDGNQYGFIGDQLSSNEEKWLSSTDSFSGSDFDDLQIRLASMNLFLHNIPEPNLKYMDALSDKFSHKEQADIVLANPPFAGAIDKDEMSDEFRLTIKTKAFLFVDLFEQILFEGGRAAVIVPEGVLFNRNPQPIMNRKRLLENNTLEAIISLPQGVFSPYSKVKTSILIWKKGGRTDVVPMFEMKNDGYTLDDIRKKISENDIPKIINSWDKRKNKDSAEKNNWLLVPIDKIEKNKYDLNIKLYKEIIFDFSKYKDSKLISGQIFDKTKEFQEKLKDLNN